MLTVCASPRKHASACMGRDCPCTCGARAIRTLPPQRVLARNFFLPFQADGGRPTTRRPWTATAALLGPCTASGQRSVHGPRVQVPPHRVGAASHPAERDGGAGPAEAADGGRRPSGRGRLAGQLDNLSRTPCTLAKSLRTATSSSNRVASFAAGLERHSSDASSAKRSLHSPPSLFHHSSERPEAASDRAAGVCRLAAGVHRGRAAGGRSSHHHGARRRRRARVVPALHGAHGRRRPPLPALPLRLPRTFPRPLFPSAHALPGAPAALA